jgi:LmbE family N-acetylglucosaminyl deacetylase
MIRVSGVSIAGAMLGVPRLNSLAGEENKERGNKLKVVVAGAHPDDPETGCGGLMSLYANEGHEVVSAYLTRGEAGIPGKSHTEAAGIRTAEALKACGILKARAEFLGQIDGSCEINEARYVAMNDFLEKENPDVIFTHWPIDTHRDHRVCSTLVYDAWLNLGKKSALYYFEVMTGVQSQNFSPTNYADISSVIDQKHAACFAHVSQDIEDEYPRSHGLMEKFRGLEANCSYAEGYIRHSQSLEAPLK